MAEERSTVTIKRERLYAEVWATPMRTLAEKYGVSDVGLAKACNRHKIPRPPRGYWAKLAHGKEPPRAPLPPLDDERLDTVRFSGAAGERAFHDPELESLKVECVADERLTVPERLSSPHRLIVATREYRKAIDAGRAGGAGASSALNIHVSRSSLSRALRIMDTIIKAWEFLGGTISVEEYIHDRSRRVTYFSLGEDRVSVEMEEKDERIPGQPRWRGDRRFTGQLVLRLNNAWGTNLRGTWSDGKRQRLDNLIDSIITGLLKRIDREKQRRLDNEIEGRQTRRAKERRAAAERREAEEQRRREQLKIVVDNWHEAERIRHYLSVLDAEVGAGNLEPRNEAAFNQWLKWGFWYADHIDPLIRAEPLTEEYEPPENTPIERLEWTRHTRPILEQLSARDTDELHGIRIEEIHAAEGNGPRRAWDEVCRVLEGLGYDMAGRRYRLR